jgi:regulator of PEP synthase PpsR (kinase-PPPase family)
MPSRRSVFFVSDRTGITVEMLGNSLLTQFDDIEFRRVTLPFIDTLEKAREARKQIGDAFSDSGMRPIVFTSLVTEEVRIEMTKVDGLVLDLFERFIVPLEEELGIKSAHAIGRSHSAGNFKDYNHRIEAVNYTLAHDDGVTNRNLDQADIILVGVSRSGKTPTCLYMALQFGVKTANYPLIPEDFERGKFPSAVTGHRGKCFGLTIDPERLHQVRNERRPGSKYADLLNCRYEVNEAEKMMKREGIAWLSSTHKSIEEIATTILRDIRPDRLVY